MTKNSLIERLEEARPAIAVAPGDVDRAWEAFQDATRVPVRRRRHRSVLIGVGSLASVGAAIILVIGLLPGTPPPGAAGAAATLHKAALADASSALLPGLTAGQYYYQESLVTMDCTFASGSSPLIRYVSEGTIESWSSPNNPGQIVITPSPVGQDGSHFATSADESAWEAAGKPFVPCALASPSNALNGNPANADTQGSLGGYSATVSGYSAFGVILGDAKVATPIEENGAPSLILTGGQNSAASDGTNVANLPSDVTQLLSMLADGEINADGSVSSTPQPCPVNSQSGAGVGCDTNQELALIKELLQLPDASAKFGSVLYQVLAEMPGATVVANSVDSFGNTGTSVTVPVTVGTTAAGGFQVLIDPTTGTLLSSTDLLRAGYGIGASGALLAPDASISYGEVSVVSGLGLLPSSSS